MHRIRPVPYAPRILEPLVAAALVARLCRLATIARIDDRAVQRLRRRRALVILCVLIPRSVRNHA